MTAKPALQNAASSAMAFDQSARQIRENAQWIAGGVNSNFRLNIAPTPLVFERAEGPYLFDIDGNRLIDYYLGMGPMILGHSPHAVRQAVHDQVDRGILFAGQGALEVEAARLVCEMVPCAERVRFGSSGSEVVQAAMRLARAATGRRIILKFEGHYHGWFDNILWSTAPGLNAAGPEDSPVPVAGSTGQDPRRRGRDRGPDLERSRPPGAAPRPGRRRGGHHGSRHVQCGRHPPGSGYLEGAREACTRHGAVLIFDEVITGLPAGPRRRAGALRRHPGSRDLRQGDRQRLSGRGAGGTGRPPRPLRDRRRRARRHLQRAMHLHGRHGRDPARA